MRSTAYLALCVSIVTSGVALGEAESGGLIEKGLQLRRQHRDAEALELFRRANEANPTPRARAQIALAEQALGQWVGAERDLHAAMTSAEDPWIASHGEALRGALAAIEKHLATLTVQANVTQGEVFLNGTRAGDLPLTAARVPSGAVTIEVRSSGYETASRAIELAPGASVTEELRLTASVVPYPSAAPASDAMSPRPTPPGERPPLVVQAPPLVSPGDTTRRAFAWGALGAAGAFLGGAVIAQIINENRTSKYNDDAQCLYGQLSRDERCGVYRGQAETAQTLATVGYVAAGTLGVGAAILFLVNPAKPKTTGISAWLDVGTSGARLDIGGKF